MPIVDKRILLSYHEDIKPHEEIIFSNHRRLLRNMERTGVIYRPVIVDKDTLTIIDGHHRYQTLVSLGYKFIPVVQADYMNDIYQIKPPIIKINMNTDILLDLIEHQVKRGPGNLFLIGADERVVVLRKDPLDTYYMLKDIAMISVGKERKGYTRIIPPKLNPYDIRRAAGSKGLLPPKSTIHITRLKNYYYPIRLSYLE